MTVFGEPPVAPEDRPSEQTEAALSCGPSLEPAAPIGGAQERSPHPVSAVAADDLGISWSWPHFLVFLSFGFFSLVLVQGFLAVAYAPHQKLSPKQMEAYLLSKPQFAIGSMLLWYALLFFFLYVTLSLLRGLSFWRTLGWRRIEARKGELPSNPLLYFLSGSGLSLLVAFLSARMKSPENLPMEELFKYRQTALLFLAMAVFVAPLVEETLFRGYLYPLFARSFGVAPGILLTGLLFGLMHGAQLGWTWSLVSILIFVGVIFTIVRARTGTVFASYLMHLGYNSMISIFAILGTHGFRRLPAPH